MTCWLQRVTAVPARLACAETSQPAPHGSVSKLRRVWESLQDGIVPRWSQIFNYPTKDWIQQATGVHYIKVEGNQFAVQMQLRLVVERIAVVVSQTLAQRPRNDVSQRVKI